MATSTITPFPNVPMPFMPGPSMPTPFTAPDELQKIIKSSVESTIIDVMNNPSNELGQVIRKHVKESLECDELMHKIKHKLDGGEHKGHHGKSYLEHLFCEIVDYHKHIMGGKPIFDIEHEITDKHKDLSSEETKVLSCLLRSDGPVKLASMIGMEVDDFIETMKHLGKRFQEHED